jgi:hypothetical protein
MPDPLPPPTWSPGQQPAIGGTGVIALRPETFARHERATRYVEQMVRRLQSPGKRGKTTEANAGTWGWLRPGDTITGASGLTLGSGTVTLCTRDGATLTPDPAGETVTVYNTCPAITGDPTTGTALPLHWVDAWTIG